MSTKSLRDPSSVAETLRRWLVAPETIWTWLVATAVWMSVAFAVSLLVGSYVGEPSDGIPIGILLSGLCLVFTVDRMWRRLEDPV
ncbi:MAG: hypothetical protein ACOC0Z_05765 [Halohasta sp.]